MSILSFKIIDHSGEYSSVAMNIPDVTDVNWSATNTGILAIQTAIQALTAGNISQESLTAWVHALNDTYPSNEFAQRETGLRLFYKDTGNNKKFHITIPAPDLNLVAEVGSDQVDMSTSVVAALTALLETWMRSPYGNTVSFYKGVIVGRRN